MNSSPSFTRPEPKSHGKTAFAGVFEPLDGNQLDCGVILGAEGDVQEMGPENKCGFSRRGLYGRIFSAAPGKIEENDARGAQRERSGR